MTTPTRYQVQALIARLFIGHVVGKPGIKRGFGLPSFNRFFLGFVLLTAGSCTNNSAPETSGQNVVGQDSAVVPQIIYLSHLPDTLRPVSILLSEKPKPLMIKVPDNKKSGSGKSHPLYPEILLSPPTEIKAGYSTVTKNYSTDDGLVVDVMSVAFTDSKGNLWFGSFVGGLSKFDGHTFTSYTTTHGLVSNDISTITEDSDGNLWIGTAKGVSVFDGTGFRTIKKFTGVSDILQDHDGSFWVTTGSGLFHYRENELTRYTTSNGLTSNRIYCVAQDEKERIWLGTDSGISVFDGVRFLHLDQGIDDQYKPVKRIVIGMDQLIWAASFYGFFSIDQGVNTYYPRGNRTAHEAGLFEDSRGRMWISHQKGGVIKFDRSGQLILNRSSGLASDIITGITEDNAGNMWFGTDAGISKYSGEAVINYTELHGLIDNSIRTILKDDKGRLFFAGNSKGMSLFDGERFTNYAESQGLHTSDFWASEMDGQGNIWLGSINCGLIRYDGTSFYLYNEDQGLPDNDVYYIYRDSDGSLYVATKNGFSRIHGDTITNFNGNNGLLDGNVFCITKDRSGRFWLGTGSGVSVYDGSSFINYSGQNGPGSHDIKAILEDKAGNIWLGSYGQGIYRFDGNYFHQYTTEDGLPDNTVTQLAFSKDGHLIIGTNNGIAILEGFKPGLGKGKDVSVKPLSTQNELPNKLLTGNLPVFKIYNSSTGYLIKDVNRGQRSIFTEENGDIWIATGSEKSGLVRFNPNAIEKNKKSPDVNLTSLKVNNEDIIWHDLLPRELSDKLYKQKGYSKAPHVVEEVITFGKPLSDKQIEDMRTNFANIDFEGVRPFYPIPEHLVLPHNHNSITIEFAAIEPSDPELVQYSFWLKGYDKDWSKPSDQTAATFGNIYEGDYTFNLRARTAGGEWSEPVVYSFKVLPPWFRTWWAYLIYTFTFLFGLRVFSKFRERRLVAEKEKLERTVRDRTSELIQEKKKSDDLLLNILPEEIAQELKEKGEAEARGFDRATILFTDFKEFTRTSEQMDANKLVSEINHFFKAFDHICEKYGIEKIKTIGDSYMAAGGLPVPTAHSTRNTVLAGLEMAEFVKTRKDQRAHEGKTAFEMRVGINTGPVVAGIVGVKKFQYDIWGDTVNTASRMETHGEVGKVNISESTFELIRYDPEFVFEARGKVQAKGKGEVNMYFVSRAGS